MYLNLKPIHFEALSLGARLVPMTALAIGLCGSLFKARLIRFVGWIGIVMFFVVSVALSFPSEDYVLGHSPIGSGTGPREVSAVTVSIKLLMGFAITMALILTYRRARPVSDRSS
jgi:hypothetical protein